jgi:hypothetical protein
VFYRKKKHLEKVLLARRALNRIMSVIKRTIKRSSGIVIVRVRVGEARAGGGRRTASPTDLEFFKIVIFFLFSSL